MENFLEICAFFAWLLYFILPVLLIISAVRYLPVLRKSGSVTAEAGDVRLRVLVILAALEVCFLLSDLVNVTNIECYIGFFAAVIFLCEICKAIVSCRVEKEKPVRKEWVISAVLQGIPLVLMTAFVVLLLVLRSILQHVEL